MDRNQLAGGLGLIAQRFHPQSHFCEPPGGGKWVLGVDH